MRFAVIGDYGSAGPAEESVSTLVKSWNPDFVLTIGDNNYPDGAAGTIDENIGQYYHEFIYPYTGAYGTGAAVNRFFPALGNHDWGSNHAQPYQDYFVLPGNERYYDFTAGPVQFFALDSDSHEPDGNTSSSSQALWLQNQLAVSTAAWKLVYFHHSPYTSGRHDGPTPAMRWPFQEWGATAVLSGHEHNYERILLNGFPYIVNGLGGSSIYSLGALIPGSVAHYDANYGALLVQADPAAVTFQFFAITGELIDTYTIAASVPGATPTPPSACPLSFTDVPVGSVFYPYITCLACRGIVSGYQDGTFRPDNSLSRGQLAKVVAGGAGFTDTIPPAQQTFADVPPGHPFWRYIETLALHGTIGGYTCGGPGEPCDTQGRPYFRPYAEVTRGQIAKIVVGAAAWGEATGAQVFEDVPVGQPFYGWIGQAAAHGVLSGYTCGSAGEPCIAPGQRPYFRPGEAATRGQMSKIIYNAFPSAQPCGAGP